MSYKNGPLQAAEIRREDAEKWVGGRSFVSDHLVESRIDRDQQVVALARKLAAVDRVRLNLVAAIETARVEAFWRLVEQTGDAHSANGAVMPADVRAQFTESIAVYGLDAIAGVLGVSPALFERLVAGIPTPIDWIELPEEQAVAAE